MYPIGYTVGMYLIETTIQFDKWLKKLKDKSAIGRILTKLKMVELGNLGDSKSVGGRVSELRLTYGPGYRIYFSKKGNTIILLLHGGNKSNQSSDIKKAKAILKELEINHD
jgi:putative addiction module killer protein